MRSLIPNQKTNTMKTLFAIGLSILGFGCIDKTTTVNSEDLAYTSTYNTHSKRTDPYDVKLFVGDEGNNTYNLTIFMKLSGGPFILSPLSPNDYVGHFTIRIDENPHLMELENISETPALLEQVSPWGEGLVKFVKEDTKFRQKLVVKTQEDFEVSGWLQFVIEARCIPEKIPFLISNKEGVLTIKKT